MLFFCTFSIEMYYHIVYNGSVTMSEIYKEHAQIYTPANQDVDEGILAVFNSFSTEMHHFVMGYDSKALENFCKRFLELPYLLIIGIILE